MNYNKRTCRWQRFKRRVLQTTVVCILVPFLLAGCGKPGNNETEATTASAPTEETAAELSVTDLLKAVLSLKSDMETAMDDVKEDNIESAKQKMEGVFQKTETIRTSLNASVEALGDGMPSLKTQLESIGDILDLVDLASEKLMLPMFTYLQEHPLTEAQSDDGIRVAPLLGYLDLMESLMPDVEALVAKAKETDLSLVDSDGKLTEYLEEIGGLLELYKKDSSVISRVKSMLGADGDRTYLIAAQNSAEIRASGGFPGAMGVIRIQNGVLVLEDFKKVYNVLATNTPQKANVTRNENKLFHYGLAAPRDADYCPDFERVAYIWALGYEAKQDEPVDGVISATPAIVQKILAAIDKEIKLFDGTMVNGENAVKVLQHDLYFTYFGRKAVSGASVTADQLFADAAKKTAEKLTENMSFSNLKDYVSIASECFEDRTLMLWMVDEAEQSMIRKLGWHGGLNQDPEPPQAGIYYNCTIASKMGWFLIMDPQIGERTRNDDGSYTYPMTVTFSNDITKEEISEAGHYITAGRGGAIVGSAYFFAPAGGTVSDFTVSNGLRVSDEEYNDLQLGYLQSFSISPGKTVTVTYNVTTAPGVETMLTLSKTPTVQDYHE